MARSNLALKNEMLKHVQRAEQDCEWFFNDFLNFKPLPWQIKAIDAVFDVRRKLNKQKTKVNHQGKNRITIRSCHGPGKTQMLGMLMHIWNFTTYGKIACTAPKQDQLLRRLLPRYRTVLRNAPEAYRDLIEVLGREIVFCNDKDWGSNMETACETENLAGLHEEFGQLFVIDEASSRRLDPMFPVIEGALTTPGSVSVEIGNPTRIGGEFYNHHTSPKLKDLYYRMHVKPKDAPALVTKQWLKIMATKYGKDSPIYLVRAAGEFASFDEAILIPLEHIETAFINTIDEDGSHPYLRVSVDVADGGADSTVITVAKKYASFTHVLKQKGFNFPPSESPILAAEAAITLFEAYGGVKDTNDDLVIDANGVGAGTAGHLIKKGYNVKRYVGGQASANPNRWRNMRVQVHMSMYEAFRDEKIIIDEEGIDDAEDLRLHLLCIKRADDAGAKLDDIQTADKTKKDAGFSPDRDASLSLQFIDAVPEQIQSSIELVTLVGESQVAGVYDGSLV